MWEFISDSLKDYIIDWINDNVGFSGGCPIILGFHEIRAFDKTLQRVAIVEVDDEANDDEGNPKPAHPGQVLYGDGSHRMFVVAVPLP